MLAITFSAFDQGRTGSAEESLRDVEPAHGVDVPQRLSRRQLDRVQLSFRAERVDDPVGNDRHGPRPFVEPKIVPVGGGIRVPPLRCAGRRVERVDDFTILETVEQDQTVVARQPARSAPGRPARARALAGRRPATSR